MIERQRMNTTIFSDYGTSPRPELTTSTLSSQLPSDTRKDDDLPTTGTRTPIKTLSSLGPMDVFLGSSPTPHARNRSQQVVRDESSVSTPNAVRTVRLAHEIEELGSSPPQLEKNLHSTIDEIAVDSFKYRQSSMPNSISFDEGTTLEEDLLSAPEAVTAPIDEDLEDESPTELDMDDMLSSAIDLQLTAQLDAELNARIESSKEEEEEEESHNIFVDAPEHTEMEEAQVNLSVAVGGTDVGPTSSSTSRVGDSFSNSITAKDDPQVQTVRRSSRITGSSPRDGTSTQKRKQTSVDTPTKNKTSKKVVPIPSSATNLAQMGEEDSIVLATPRIEMLSQNTRGSKRKSRGTSQSPATTLRPSLLRSGSVFGQAETQSDEVLVEGTPTPKRARRGRSKDVSENKTTPGDGGSHIKRLSHVQVTPKSSSSLTSLSSSVHQTPTIVPNAEEVPVDRTPAQHANGIHDEDTEDQIMHEAIQSQPSSSTKQKDVGTAQHVHVDATPPAQQNQSQLDGASAAATPRRSNPSLAERVILTPRSIIDQLRGFRDYLRSCKDMVLGRAEEREMDDILFDMRVDVHAAARRGEGQ